MPPVKRKAPDNRKFNPTEFRFYPNSKFKVTGSNYNKEHPIGYFTEKFFNVAPFNSYLMVQDGYKKKQSPYWYRTFKDNGFIHWYVGKDEVVTVMSRGKPLEERRGAIAHDSMIEGEQTYIFPGLVEDAWCTLYSLYNYLRGHRQIFLYGFELPPLLSIGKEDAKYVMDTVDGVATDRGVEYNNDLVERIKPIRTANQLRILEFLAILGSNYRFQGLLYSYKPWVSYYDTDEKREKMLYDWYLAIDKIRRTIK